jgi:tRNA uridine 5-carboxymethylaminomethyl modification enzyme
VAGLNAAARAGGSDPIAFDRAEGYLGVMIDDLVTRGVTEPYRIFTSRAEYRLTLRADNADQRLTAKGIAIGCVGSTRAAAFGTKAVALDAALILAQSLSVTPNEAERHGLALKKDGQRRSAIDILSYPNIGMADAIRIWPQLAEIAPAIAQQIETDAKYAVYLDRQNADVAAYRRDEGLQLPDGFAYSEMTALSMEVRQKLESVRPQTLGQAGRIDGMTPAALTLLAAHIRRGARPKKQAEAAR